MSHKRFRIILFALGFFALAFFSFSPSTIPAFASDTDGTIDPTYKYAWGENAGWINFGCTNCDVHITDAGITGNAWMSQYGWINLSPTTEGITNDAEGNLSGFAWSSNLGWIDFDGVTINASGEFLGYATIDSDNSQISFNCTNGGTCGTADFKVKTDWRPASIRNPVGGGGGGGSSGSYPTPPYVPPAIPPYVPPYVNPIANIFNNIYDFFNPKPPVLPIGIGGIPKLTPLAFGTNWNLLPVEAIRQFVFAPLPYEVRALAQKFPELDRTLKSVGITRMTDFSKLNGVSLNLPGITELTNTLRGLGAGRLADLNKINNVNLNIPGLSNTLNEKLGGDKIALIQGVPVSNFSALEKKNLPSEFVFARAGQELVDLNVALSVGDKGEVTQQISYLPNQKLRLVVKPISPARSVAGYFMFKSATPKITRAEIPRSSLSASALLSIGGLVEENPEPIPVENKFVLSSFEYTDPDRDGIYTADVISPAVPGEYEVVTVIEYQDPTLGTRQMRLITLIDPEGYVYEKNGGKETRIPSAVISLYQLNPTTKEYELWKAEDYIQENPQTTDVRGTYSFLVPEGSYYFEVEAPGYKPFTGKVFAVTSGAGVHENIELKGEHALPFDLDWQTIFLIVVLLLLVYNLYRNKMRDKLLKVSNENHAR